MVEAASGITLDAYIDGHILRPLGMRDTAYALSDEQLARHVSTHRRRDDGGLDELPFTAPQPSVGGGAGLASTARDYARFLRFMLTDGALDGARLLSPVSMATFTANHTGEIVAGEWQTAAPATSNDLAFSDGGTARHSLGFLRAGRDVPGARAEGTLSWGGIANTYFWIDRRTGVAGTVFMQVTPFADPTCLGVLDDFERALYATVRA
jgi:CubicO group peptidase (beta-lactamase class C family)